MAMRRNLRGMRCAAVAAVMLAAATAAGEPGQSSGAMTVSVTVVRSCTVSDASPSTPANSVTQAGASAPAARSAGVRCGKQTLAFPTVPGSEVSARSHGEPLSVAKSADGRLFVVQF
jgi:hypothetical protein